MSLYTIKEETLTAIGDAIREKNGSTETYSSSEMAAAIRAIEVGTGGIGEVILTGDCAYAFAAPAWNNMISDIKTQNVNNCKYMFYNNKTLTSPGSLTINYDNSDDVYVNCECMFYGCENLQEIPTMTNCKVSSMSSMFKKCYNLRALPEDMGSWFDTSNATSLGSIFASCYSLRSIPSGFVKSVNMYSSLFDWCHTLNEAIDLPVGSILETHDSNLFSSYTFRFCNRLKDIIFKTNNGKPVKVKWSGQTIDLTLRVGYFNGSSESESYINNYNSGINYYNKCVSSKEKYQALKDDPDWFAYEAAYSRYNHDSAVRTINSLPDASSHVSSTGKTNIIKFEGDSGSATDGGAINKLTDSEIAVAAAKGWTVTLE